MSKFQRTFTMTVQGRSGVLRTIRTPLTVIFEINKRWGSGVDSAHFMVYNLSAETRADIEYDNAIDAEVRRSFQFMAGYASEGAESLLFQGTIKKAFYYREGPDIITDITVMDGLTGVQKAQIEHTRKAPFSMKTEAEVVIKTMSQYGIGVGAIGSLFDNHNSTRGVTWIGSTWDVLKKLAAANGGVATIKDEKVYLLAHNDILVASGDVPQIDSSSGLIGTPRRSGWIVTLEMLFEPKMRCGIGVNVASLVNKSINGKFKSMAMGHRGIISGAKDGGVITSLELQGNPEQFMPVTPR